MPELGAFEAKNKFGQLLDWVEQGEAVTITGTASQPRGWCPSDLTSIGRLSVYDAAYLELAQRRGLPLATLDAALCSAAAALGVRVLGGPA